MGVLIAVRYTHWLNFKTGIKRLDCKTICYSKSELMHDIVIGLFINRYEFCLSI